MTSTAVGQGSDKSIEKSTKRHGSWQAWTIGERKARSHSAVVTPEQGRVSRAPYESHDIYEGRVCQQYGQDDLKQYQHDRLKDRMLRESQTTEEKLVKPIMDA